MILTVFNPKLSSFSRLSFLCLFYLGLNELNFKGCMQWYLYGLCYRHALREYNIHKTLDHARIVKLHDVFEIDNNS